MSWWASPSRYSMLCPFGELLRAHIDSHSTFHNAADALEEGHIPRYFPSQHQPQIALSCGARGHCVETSQHKARPLSSDSLRLELEQEHLSDTGTLAYKSASQRQRRTASHG